MYSAFVTMDAPHMAGFDASEKASIIHGPSE